MIFFSQNLLNADDEKDGSLTHKMNPLTVANRHPIQRPRSVTSGVKSDNNNMLLQVSILKLNQSLSNLIKFYACSFFSY